MRSLRTPAGHGGDIWSAAREAGVGPNDLLDVSANLHPWGAPSGVRGAMLRALDCIEHYPEPDGGAFRVELSARVGAQVTLGNGATELLVAFARRAKRVVLRRPCYGGYAEAARAAGVPVVYDEPFSSGDVHILGRPNNPDGRMPSVCEIGRLAVRFPGTMFVVDESFLGFTGEGSAVELTRTAANVAVVCSLTKTYAIPGLRLGWATGLPPGAVPPWSVNALALAAGAALLQSWDWPLRPPLDAWRTSFQRDLSGLPGVVSVRGAANFLLVELGGPWASELRGEMLAVGILIRDASNIPGLNTHFVRLCVRAAAENATVVDALATCLLRRDA